MKYSVIVKPNSKKGPLIEDDGQNGLMVYLRELPVEGAANTGLIKLLAKHFKVAKSKISITCGHKSRKKIVSIDI